MKRKDFLSQLLPLTAGLSLHTLPVDLSSTETTNIPPYLKAGDTIGITSPAGYITNEEIMPAVRKMKEWGFEIKVGNTIGKRNFTFGGTDEERTADLQQMMNDSSIKAIMCARGGYGCVRIIDKLDFTLLEKQPKWIIGFSDVTVLHNHLAQNVGIASLHSKMCNSFPDDWDKAEPQQRETIESIRRCLVGEKMNYSFAPSEKNKLGTASGLLIGGNLKTIESLSASKSDINTKNKILFVEDTGEYLYSIDRMFWNLERSGKLSKLKGLVVGGFKTKKDDDNEEFGKTVEDILLEKVKDYNYPVCFNFPVGHQKNNYALKCGVRHQLTVQPGECSLTEIR